MNRSGIKIIWKSGVLKIIWKLKFWKLEFWILNLKKKIGVLKIKFLKIGILKIIWKLEVWKLEFWKLKFWKLNLKIGILKIIWKFEFWKLNFDMWGWRIKEDDTWPLGGALEGDHSWPYRSGAWGATGTTLQEWGLRCNWDCIAGGGAATINFLVLGKGTCTLFDAVH